MLLRKWLRYLNFLPLFYFNRKYLLRYFNPLFASDYKRNAINCMQRCCHAIVEFHASFWLHFLFQTNILLICECLRNLNTIFVNISVADLHILEDVFRIVIAFNWFNQIVKVVYQSFLLPILHIQFIFLFFESVCHLAVKPLFREFVLIKLMNVQNETFYSRPIHSFKYGLISCLLIARDVRDLTRLNKLSMTF